MFYWYISNPNLNTVIGGYQYNDKSGDNTADCSHKAFLSVMGNCLRTLQHETDREHRTKPYLKNVPILIVLDTSDIHFLLPFV